MTTVKISELTAVTSLDDASIFPVVKSGTTYKVTTANLKGSVLANVPGANVTGTLASSVTGNITSLGTLGNVTVTANITAGNVIVGGGSGGNIAGANVITANTINTTALTANGAVNLGAVGNITITGGTSGYVLSTDGSGTLSWVAQTVSSTYANSNVASYLPTYSGNLTAGNVVVSGNLTISGTTTTVNSTTTRIIDPVIELGGGANGAALSTNDSKDRGQLLHYYSGSSTVDAFMGWKNSAGEFVFASNASLSNDVATINTYGNIHAGNANLGNLVVANYHSGNGSLLTSITGANVSGTVANATYSVNAGNAYAVTGANVSGTVANATYATTAGTVTTAAQPNITSVGTLTSLAVTGNITAGNASLGNAVTANYFVGNGSQLTGLPSGYANSNVASYLPTFTGNLTAGNANLGNAATANYFVGNGSLLTGITSTSATTAGTVTTAAQPNITSHGTLTGLASGGTVNFTTSSNVSLGPVANVHITGGTSGYVLSTDGSGTLSWVAQSASSSYGDSNVGSYLANYSGNLSAANLTVSSVPNFSSTGYMLVPKGSTAQRPGSGVAGYVRYNTDLGVLECYNAQGAWQPAGGYKHVTVSSSTYTASSWDFCWTDTSSAAITITLPSSPVKGDTIRFVDVANNFGTNNLTISRNGQKVQGDTTDMTVTVSGAAFDLIYFNATYGWRVFSV